MMVLSLFDGMSCGQIALRELGIIPTAYYASEVDKHAIRQTQLNFPETVQLGDVTRWREWPIDWGKVDLLLAGSPCQGFSFAGRQLAFNDPRSRLFFEFVDILNHIRNYNPNVKFLLENVEMKKEHLRIITDYCGVFPVHINSALVSAQNRERVYWSNIRVKREGLFGDLYTDIPQPADEGILLKDILQTDVPEKYYLNNSSVVALIEQIRRQKTANFTEPEDLIVQRPRGKNQGGIFRHKAPTISANAWKQNNLLVERRVIQVGNCVTSGKFPNPQRGRIYSPEGIAPTLDACGGGNREPKIITYDYRIRRLTPTELSRLQTVPEWYNWFCSDTQIRRMCGNGWTIKAIKHIMSYGS